MKGFAIERDRQEKGCSSVRSTETGRKTGPEECDRRRSARERAQKCVIERNRHEKESASTRSRKIGIKNGPEAFNPERSAGEMVVECERSVEARGRRW